MFNSCIKSRVFFLLPIDPLTVVSPILSEKSVKNQPKYQCQECGKKCKNEIQLYNHKEYHKSLEKIPCENCNEIIEQKCLKAHLEDAHDVEIDPNAPWFQGNVKGIIF